jgi:hypothetical protein
MIVEDILVNIFTHNKNMYPRKSIHEKSRRIINLFCVKIINNNINISFSKMKIQTIHK